MKIYRQKYKDKRNGKKKKCRCWYLTFTDNQQTRRRLPAFANKRATEKAAQKIEELLSCGGILSPDLQKWLKQIPEKMRNKLIEFGIIDITKLFALRNVVDRNLQELAREYKTIPHPIRTLKEITKKDIPEMSGIYFIFDDGEIVYVGQSKNLRKRIFASSHKNIKGAEKISWIEMPLSQLNFAECFYIGICKPKRNFSRHTKEVITYESENTEIQNTDR